MATLMIVIRSRAGVGKTGSGSRFLARIVAGLGTTVTINPEPRTITPRDRIVNYGVRGNGLAPTLNANAATYDKFEEIQRLARAGVATPSWHLADSEVDQTGQTYVMLARKRHHTHGSDIRIVLEPEERHWYAASGWDFFTQYIPVAREFRVWTYRRQHLGTYEKVMAHPGRYTRPGRNQHNGFAFNLVRSADVPREAVAQAARAVWALGLDFGAVDVIEGKDAKYYVLEVNSAPGFEGEDRVAVRGLAEKIVAWAAHPVKQREFE